MSDTKRTLLQRLWRMFLGGLVAVLPLAITVAVVVWLVRAAESFFGGFARVVLPAGWYVPGLGVVLAIVVVLLVGLLLNAWLINRLVALGGRLLERIPLVKTLYTGVRDLLRFFARSGDSDEIKHVVSVELQPDIHVIGFVTDDDAGRGLPELARDDDRLVAVYLPMGYQLGGYTLYLPASRLRSLDLSIEEAMRVVLTAGVNRPRRDAAHGERAAVARDDAAG